jgi:hypothetical protein
VDRLDILKVVVEQINNPLEETTIELLKKVELIKTDNIYDSIHFKEYEDEYAFYFQVSNRRFYFVCFTDKEGEYKYASIEPYNDIYLLANTKNHTKSQLENLVGITFSDGWSVGDKWGKQVRSFTSGKLKLDNQQFSNVESQLEVLINYLKGIKESIELLKKHADCKLIIASWQHITNINGLYLNESIITSVNKLGLEIDYMPYVFK